MEILECVCIRNPHGDKGLHGFALNGRYVYEAKERYGFQTFFVYNMAGKGPSPCNRNIFHKFFQPIEKLKEAGRPAPQQVGDGCY